MERTQAIPPEHFSRILEQLQKSNAPVIIRDSKEKLNEFHKEGEEVYVYEINESTGERSNKQRVVDVTTIPELRRAIDPVMVELRKEFPDMTDEELEAEADGIKEMDRCIQLIKNTGFTEEEAFQLITSITEEDVKEHNSAEALANLLKQREAMFPKRSYYEFNKECAEETEE